jgi:hypothetical protein
MSNESEKQTRKKRTETKLNMLGLKIQCYQTVANFSKVIPYAKESLENSLKKLR